MSNMSNVLDAINLKKKYDEMHNDSVSYNKLLRKKKMVKSIIFKIFRFLIFIGISYIILGPIITMVSRSFFSDADLYNPLVYLFPKEMTMDRYDLAFSRLNYFPVLTKTLIYDLSMMVIQIFICSMTGYGFARYKFPLKKLLFGLVVLTIVIPSHTIMLPLYTTFRNFDVFGIYGAITGTTGINLLGKTTPMYIMSIFGTGLRAGLYIFIFNQFFRGLPKEFEEAAYIDGAGPWYTYLRIMLVNAMPSVITVSVFSMVWQYNDTFYARLFAITGDKLISMRISSLYQTISYVDKVDDPMKVQLYLYAGIIMTIIPVMIVYIILQRKFMEGMERSGIVG